MDYVEVENADAFGDCHDYMFSRWKVGTRARQVVKQDSRTRALVKKGVILFPEGADELKVVDDIERLVRQLARVSVGQRPWISSVKDVIEDMMLMYTQMVKLNPDRYSCFATRESIKRYAELPVGEPSNRAFFKRRLMQYVDIPSRELADVLNNPTRLGSMRWLYSSVDTEETSEAESEVDEDDEDASLNKVFLVEDFGGSFEYNLAFDDKGKETAYGEAKRLEFDRFCIFVCILYCNVCTVVYSVLACYYTQY